MRRPFRIAFLQWKVLHLSRIRLSDQNLQSLKASSDLLQLRKARLQIWSFSFRFSLRMCKLGAEWSHWLHEYFAHSHSQYFILLASFAESTFVDTTIFPMWLYEIKDRNKSLWLSLQVCFLVLILGRIHWPLPLAGYLQVWSCFSVTFEWDLHLWILN